MKLKELLNICEDCQDITLDIDDAVVSGIVEDVSALIDDAYLSAKVSFIRAEDGMMNIFAQYENNAD